jgi:hypothetical protein
MTVQEQLESLPETEPGLTRSANVIEWNCALQQPWTKAQADAWERLIPRKSPEHNRISWAKTAGT